MMTSLINNNQESCYDDNDLPLPLLFPLLIIFIIMSYYYTYYNCVFYYIINLN